MKEHIKWFKIIFIPLILCAMLYSCFRKEEVRYIILNNGMGVAEIPEEIRRSKDCNKYHEWFYSNFTPLTVSDDRCPWSKPPKGKVGEFIVGGVKLWVPRKYLLVGKMAPDGYQEGLLLNMVYPEMKADTGKKEERYLEVMVHIKTCPLNRDCNEIQQRAYEIRTGIYDATKEEKQKYPKKIKYFPELDLNMFEVENNHREFYIRGDVLKPSYYLICDGGTRNENWNPGCYGWFEVDGKFYVKYSFRQTDLLIHHDEVRQKIIGKIREWQQDPNKGSK